ncbi:hypothetical protein BKA64DRAFT_655712 [Cadophora sp. MPI-SDFR-AT-0126]|nr:hypothetical protein BKA64DRAFT_655712 [Leotiomycetes sp. MPI-SDFR-AT-0126]
MDSKNGGRVLFREGVQLSESWGRLVELNVERSKNLVFRDHLSEVADHVRGGLPRLHRLRRLLRGCQRLWLECCLGRSSSEYNVCRITFITCVLGRVKLGSERMMALGERAGLKIVVMHVPRTQGWRVGRSEFFLLLARQATQLTILISKTAVLMPDGLMELCHGKSFLDCPCPCRKSSKLGSGPSLPRRIEWVMGIEGVEVRST